VRTISGDSLAIDRKSRARSLSLDIKTRPVEERICDFEDVVIPMAPEQAMFEASRCVQCPDPAPCVLACPTGAYTQRRGGGVVVRKNLCTRCGDCARACPVEAVYLDPGREPFVCIHCGRCIPFCPHDCLELAKVEAAAPATQEGAP
jgi:ferredoxin